MKVKAILFDKDGTLTELEAFWRESIEKTCEYIAVRCGEGKNKRLIRELEYVAGFEQGKLIPESLIVSGTNKLVVTAWLKVLEENGIETKENYFTEFSERLADMCTSFGEVKAEGDLQWLLPKLKSRGYILGIITSDLYAAATLSMKKLGVLEQFDYIVSGDRVKNPKPAQDAWKFFAQKYCIQPEEVLMVGDSENDMLFAHRCGLTGVLYRKELPSKLPVGATYGIRDLSEFLDLLSDIEESREALWIADKKSKKTVIVSDIHLGIEDQYAETVKNRSYFVSFLRKLRNTSDVFELVIAGDFLDQWFLPMDYRFTGDCERFYQAVIENNMEVMGELKRLIRAGISVVYILGNHDMLLEASVLEKAIPGIVIIQDAKGLGAYYTGTKGNIVIEHGHRYDVFSAPDSFSNKELCQNEETLLPPGYFYARYGASWVSEGRPKISKEYPSMPLRPEYEDQDQMDAYLYATVLCTELNRITPKTDFREKAFAVKNIGGFQSSFSVEDFYPIQQEDGSISASVLYRNFQRTWNLRQEENMVKVLIPFSEAVQNVLKNSATLYCKQAQQQYLDNENETVDVVVFGHTHIPELKRFDTGKLYINSGAWTDHNPYSKDGLSRTFVVVYEDEEQVHGSLFYFNEMEDVIDIS